MLSMGLLLLVGDAVAALLYRHLAKPSEIKKPASYKQPSTRDNSELVGTNGWPASNTCACDSVSVKVLSLTLKAK